MFPQWGQMPVQKTDDKLSYPPLMSNGQPWPEVVFSREGDPREPDLALIVGDKKSIVTFGSYFDRHEMISKRPSTIFSVRIASFESAARALFPEEKLENSKAFLAARIKERYEDGKNSAVRFEEI
jgi:hypothetical protein